MITSLDITSAIEYATQEVIDTFDFSKQYDMDELKEVVLTQINGYIDEHNVVCDKGNKWKYPDRLPNLSVAMLIQKTHIVKNVSWLGNNDEYCYMCFYEDSGENEGLYTWNDNVFKKIVYEYKAGAVGKDFEEIKAYLGAHAEYVTPSNDPDLIAVNNGIFDYKTKQLLSFSPDYVFTAKSRVNYVSNAVNPHYTMHDGLDWDVDTWFGTLSDDPDIVKLLWEVVGAIIRPHVRWDKMVCMYSQKGMNGKGTLCELMKQLCGEGSYAAIPISRFGDDKMLVQLITATAVITDENATTDFTRNAENLKSVITGDSISIDRKYKDSITFKPSVVVVQSINALPRTADTTDSMYRRFLIIPFDKTFRGVERKYIKADYLHRKEVLEYVMCKVLNTDYYNFSEPGACDEMLDEYKNFNDPIRQFVDEMLPLFKWNLIPYKFLWDLFCGWKKENNVGDHLGKKTVLEKIRQIIASDYAGEWDCVMNQRVSKTNMSGAERLIYTYHLSDWMAPNYKGSDVDKICLPALASKYDGILRL